MTSDVSQSHDEPAPKFTGRSHDIRNWGVGVSVVLVMAFLVCSGFPWLLEAPITLALGWIMFLFHNVPRMRPGGEQVAVWLVGVVLLTIGGQRLGVRMVQARRRQLSEQDAAIGSAIAAWRFQWTLLLVLVIHAMFISGLALTGLLQQSYWVATSPEPLLQGHFEVQLRMSSSNNLKQLGLASHNYHDTFAQFPQSTFSTNGRPLHSWITLLLPYMGLEKLYDSIDLDQPWDAPSQKKAIETRLGFVENPGIRKQPSADQPAPAHYAANRQLIGLQLTTKFADIPDGTSNTILYGEIIDQFPAWGEPINWRDPADGVNQTPRGFGSPFKGGAQFTFVDGSVSFLLDEIDPAVLKALSTPAGREPSHER